jgi:murein L,D-transpeptidase YcbB/YkuD
MARTHVRVAVEKSLKLLRTAVCGAFLAFCVHGAFAADAARLSWFDGARPGTRALQAVELLMDARSHGLEPGDYDADALRQSLQRAAQEPLDPATAAELEVKLTAAMERYLGDVHSGRIDPQKLPHGYSAPGRPAFDPAAYLKTALASGLPAAARDAAPRFPQYERLREALAQYRALVDQPAWKTPLPALPPGARGSPPKLEPGQSYAGLSLLRGRLIAVGDLDPGSQPPMLYEGPIVDAVRSFQQRHGLTADGIVGRATLAQLQVAPAARVRQIELTLERLRWTPLMRSPRMIVINVPEFVLRAYEVQGERIIVRETMKIIVGKAMDTRTPLFEEQMRYIEFQPYWNVPPSIARKEVVPRLRRDPGYWEREGFEFVNADGQVVAELTSGMLDAVLAGRARIRQRPGPRNALGDIKFVFPNQDNIYLHHTPSVRLFDRDRRDFSHGCIRVEQPVALARFALQGMPEWSEDRIRQAMADGESATLKLAAPLPVLIAYGTVIVKDGRTHFFDDIYSHDRQLDAALRERRQRLATGN